MLIQGCCSSADDKDAGEVYEEVPWRGSASQTQGHRTGFLDDEPWTQDYEGTRKYSGYY